MNITKILGIFLILLAIYFIYQSIAISIYVDHSGKVVKHVKEPNFNNNYTANYYTVIDGIGVLKRFKKTLLLPTNPSIFFFILSLIFFGSYLLFSHELFRELSKTKVEKLPTIRSIILIVLLAIVIVSVKNNITNSYPRDLVVMFLNVFAIVLLIVLSLYVVINKKVITLNIFRSRNNLFYLTIGSLFCFIIINGLEIDLRSYNFSYHYAGAINLDHLGIALFTNDLTHRWSLAYTLFRVSNIILYLFGSFFLIKIWNKIRFSL